MEYQKLRKLFMCTGVHARARVRKHTHTENYSLACC